MERRKKAAIKLLELDAEVEEMLVKLGVTDTDEYINFQNDFGCMLTTEPLNYHEESVNIIEKTLND